MLIYTRAPPGGWEHLSWDTVIVGHLVNISMVFLDKITDSTLSVFPTRWCDINHGFILVNQVSIILSGEEQPQHIIIPW